MEQYISGPQSPLQGQTYNGFIEELRSSDGGTVVGGGWHGGRCWPISLSLLIINISGHFSTNSTDSIVDVVCLGLKFI